MSFMDVVLLTLMNTIICVISPRMISIILDHHRKSQIKIVTSDICRVRSRDKTKRFYYFTGSTSARS